MAKSLLSELADSWKLRLNNEANVIRYQLDWSFNYVRLKLIETTNFILPKLNEFVLLFESKSRDAAYCAIIQWKWFNNFAAFQFDRIINITIPFVRDFARFIGWRFNETSIFIAEIISRSGKRLEAMATCSAVFVILFGIVWRAIGLKPKESSKKKYEYSKDPLNRKYPLFSKIKASSFRSYMPSSLAQEYFSLV